MYGRGEVWRELGCRDRVWKALIPLFKKSEHFTIRKWEER